VGTFAGSRAKPQAVRRLRVLAGGRPDNRHFPQTLPILLNRRNAPHRYYRHRYTAPWLLAAAAAQLASRLVFGRFPHWGSRKIMTRRTLATWIAGCAVALAGAPAARAQMLDAFCEPACAHDMQLFAPVDFDFDCLPLEKECGWFLNYNRVSWHVSGERTPIGSPGLAVLSEEIFPPELANDFGDTPPPQYLVENGLTNVAPDGEFGWGNRYEFGYFSGPHGYMMGIIDNYRSDDFSTFGTGPQAGGFGSIHVNFELANPRLLEGFRDYNGQVINGNEIPTPTIGGPGIGGNGTADDLDGDLAEGFVFIFLDLNGDGDFDDDEPIIGIAIDYGDLYNFNVTFNQVAIRNFTRCDGIELMKTVKLDNSYMFMKDQNQQFEIGAGVRFFKIRDEFLFAGTSDLFRGRNIMGTQVDNQIVGPQIQLKYTRQHRRFQLGLDGRFVFGYNVQDLDQSGVFGENLTPGDLNQPAILQPTAFSRGMQVDDFSPMVEFRADLAYQITKSIALKMGYTCMFVDNVTRAATVTRWRLPDGGFTETGDQDILINGADGGIEFIY
jgi:hypothetical protein